jgi:hypothetical protein
MATTILDMHEENEFMAIDPYLIALVRKSNGMRL